MPEQLKGLVVILVIAASVFLLARQPVAPTLMSEESFKLRRNLWFVLTSVVFIAGNFWLYSILTFAIVLAAHKRDVNVPALYLTLLPAAPAIALPLPGFAGIGEFFTVNHIRVLSLALLLPVALSLYGTRHQREYRTRRTDVFVVGFALWLTVLALADLSITQLARDSFTLMLDLILPYYVASRYFQSMEQLREAAAAFVVVALIAGVIGMFETSAYWLLYYDLYESLSVPPGQASGYFVRDGLGVLRAQASLIQPIVYGYFMMIGLAFGAYFAPNMPGRLRYGIALLALLGGLVAGMSRGPWIGAMAVFAAVVVLDPVPGRRMAKILAGGAGTAVLLFLSPWGSAIIDNLPFIGSVDTGTVDYRFRLFDISMEVIAQNPLTGDRYYQLNPLMAELRQGQGIIDIVNTYLVIALPNGLIGLFLFSMIFISAGFAVHKARKLYIGKSEDNERFGRYLLATIVGIMVTIATVSNIGVTAVVYWTIVGLAVSYSSIAQRSAAAEKSVQTPRSPARHSLRQSY